MDHFYYKNLDIRYKSNSSGDDFCTLDLVNDSFHVHITIDNLISQKLGNISMDSMSNIHILIHLFLSILCFSCYAGKISYEQHCNSIVPAPAVSTLNPASDLSISLYLPYAYLSVKNSSKIFHNLTLPGFLTVHPHALFPTKSDGVFEVDSRLEFFNEEWKRLFFSMSGFYSRFTGKVCMVGTGIDTTAKGNTLSLSAVVKLYYPITSSMSNCIVRGTIESIDAPRSTNHFERVSILEYFGNNYIFTKISQAMNTCLLAESPKSESFGFDPVDSYSHLESVAGRIFVLENGKKCSTNCDASFKFMDISHIHRGEDGKVNLLISFTTNMSNTIGYYRRSLIPSQSLVSEGYWDSEMKRFCLIACKVLLDSTIGECNIGLALWFPSFYTLQNRNMVMGQMWSSKDKNHPSYFDLISLRSIDGSMHPLPNTFYKYSSNSHLRILCNNSDEGNMRDEIFQEVISNRNDLKFDISVKDSYNTTTWGHATPFSVEDDLYSPFNPFEPEITSDVKFDGREYDINQSVWNVSYKITYSGAFFPEVEIYAEGFYNSRIGRFCMVGCLLPNYRSTTTSDVMDCEIQIHIQLSPLSQSYGENNNTKSHLSGTIKSTRKKNDPLFFEPLKLSSNSIYNTEAVEMIHRMDVEVIMVLVSLTLSCIFVYFQLIFVKKNKHILSFISITMLVILVTGQIIPLVLNMDALFSTDGSNKNVVMLKSGGWLEANEIVVRIMTMVALFLYSRLLQVVWSSVSLYANAKIRTFLICLSIHCVGIVALILIGFITTWESIIPYCGLVLDFFLLPQIILNIILASKEKALVPIFYVGTSVVRALPHVYDAYRNQRLEGILVFSYIYGNPRGEFFSSYMDICVPLIGAVLGVILCLQQKLGGDFFLPQGLQRPTLYDFVICS